MKTRISLFVFLMAVLLPLNLQGQFKLGVHAGMNLETQAELGQLWDNCTINPGIMFGGTLEYRLIKGISLQTELNYQKKRENVTSLINGTSCVTKMDLNYLSVPLLLRKSIKVEESAGKLDLTFFAGPYGSYLLSAESKYVTSNSAEKKSIEAQAEKHDFGAIFGGGIIYKLKNGSFLNAELRYGMGLTEIDKTNPDLRNKSLGLTLGYTF
jgi:hypothetical protein